MAGFQAIIVNIVIPVLFSMIKLTQTTLYSIKRPLHNSENRKLKLSDAYEHYRQYCESEGYKFPEKKYTFREILKRNGFKIETSSKDANQIYVFDVMLVDKN